MSNMLEMDTLSPVILSVYRYKPVEISVWNMIRVKC